MIEAYKKDVDRTLLRENLKLTVEQRLEKLINMTRFVEEWGGAAETTPELHAEYFSWRARSARMRRD